MLNGGTKRNSGPINSLFARHTENKILLVVKCEKYNMHTGFKLSTQSLVDD